MCASTLNGNYVIMWYASLLNDVFFLCVHLGIWFLMWIISAGSDDNLKQKEYNLIVNVNFQFDFIIADWVAQSIGKKLMAKNWQTI